MYANPSIKFGDKEILINYFQIRLCKPYTQAHIRLAKIKSKLNDYQLDNLLMMLMTEVVEKFCNPEVAIKSPLYRVYIVYKEYKSNLNKSSKSCKSFIDFLKLLDSYESNAEFIIIKNNEAFFNMNGKLMNSKLPRKYLKIFAEIRSQQPLTFFSQVYLFGKTLRSRGGNCQEDYFLPQIRCTSKYGANIPGSYFSNYNPVNSKNILQDNWSIKSQYSSWFTFIYGIDYYLSNLCIIGANCILNIIYLHHR